ncbi:histidine phosphatase family protein [Vagococcus elongatus]|uniref:Histidine phosphatase family protein n=1 Tax=Vagococcus elongatus TaxID=180344 RepID=A0A430ARA1_9ENTE|nr:histidine phosphatase family protein [Vagococcus elongatus]RSU10507.1 hypothetical protein CBF29_09440 [Vagococcus elongatus]
MQIYLIRHGQTYFNKYGKMQGWSDTPLTIEGEKAAETAGKRLANEKFERVFSSDLRRTVETAKIILKYSKYNANTLIEPMKEFRETFFGEFEGNYDTEVYSRLAKKLNIAENELFERLSFVDISNELQKMEPSKDMESHIVCEKRIFAGLDIVTSKIENHNSSRVLIVTHGNVIRNIVNKITPNINVKKEINNSGITIIEYAEKKYKLTQFNDMEVNNDN